MATVLNILWVAIIGVWSALEWLFLALLLAVTIVGLPAARQCLKFANFTLWPFGRTAVRSPNASVLGPIGNILWFIPGLFIAASYVIGGLVLCLTIIGIPFGVQSFKFAGLALAPFGKEIVPIRHLRAGQQPAISL